MTSACPGRGEVETGELLVSDREVTDMGEHPSLDVETRIADRTFDTLKRPSLCGQYVPDM
jgi:hypothetical protein